jgi:hypothetical protein
MGIAYSTISSTDAAELAGPFWTRLVDWTIHQLWIISRIYDTEKEGTYVKITDE